MKYLESLPLPKPERIVSPDEVFGFRDEIVWPAVDEKFGKDFRAHSHPGNKVDMLTSYGVNGELRFSLFALCRLERRGSSRKNWITRDVSLSVEEMQSDLTSKLKKIAATTTRGKLALKGPGRLVAWEVKGFHFKDGREPFYTTHGYNLQDAEAAEHWGDEELSRRSRKGGSASDTILRRADRLNDQFETTLTTTDLVVMHSILQVMGIEVQELVI